MNLLQKLKLHTQALADAVKDEKKFFASIIHYVNRLNELTNFTQDEVSQEEFTLLANKIENFFSQYRPSPGVLYIPPSQTSNLDDTVIEINKIVSELNKMPEDKFLSLFNSTSKVKKEVKVKTQTHCIFIGHGRNKIWARLKLFLEDEIGVATISYESESRVSESIIPVLEKMLEQSTFAILILTAEDSTVDGKTRSRQNVIHEVGLFQGRLGFNKVVLLKQEGVEEFTNIAGLQYIPFSLDNIEQTFYELQKYLKKEKII